MHAGVCRAIVGGTQLELAVGLTRDLPCKTRLRGAQRRNEDRQAHAQRDPQAGEVRAGDLGYFLQRDTVRQFSQRVRAATERHAHQLRPTRRQCKDRRRNQDVTGGVYSVLPPFL